MIGSECDSHIPMAVWIKTLALSCVLFWGGYLALDLRDMAIKAGLRAEAGTREIEKVVTNCRDGQRPDLMVIGSSLVNNALCRGDLFDRALNADSMAPLTYHIAVKGHAVLADFTLKIPEILSLKPRWLFIEANMACVDMTGSQRQGPLAVSLNTYTRELLLVARLIIRHPISAFSFISSPVPLAHLDLPEMNWVVYAKNAAKFGIRSVDDVPEWKSFFKRAQQEGITVCLLDLPRASEAQAYLPRGFQERFEQLLDVYDRDLGVRYIPFPRTLNQSSCYEDAAHLNQEGSRIYSQWFAELLNQQHLGLSR